MVRKNVDRILEYRNHRVSESKAVQAPNARAKRNLERNEVKIFQQTIDSEALP